MSFDLSVVLGAISLVAIIAAIVGAVMDRKLLWRSSLVATVLAICSWGLYPPADSLRLGPDLDGGTSLLYEVDVEGLTNPQEAIRETIEVLKERVDRDGVLNLAWQVEGNNRISVLMPRPSREVKERREALDDIEKQIKASNITAHAIRQLLNQSDADYAKAKADLVKGVKGRTDLFDAARKAKQALDAADSDVKSAAGIADQAKRDELLAIKIQAQAAYDAAFEAAINSSLSVAQLRRVMNSPAKVAGGSAGQKSPREIALEKLLTDYPLRRDDIAKYQEVYEAYQEKKGRLDDPEDLKRLLRGAGVLTFRILVQGEGMISEGARPDPITQAQIASMIKELKASGPDAFRGRQMVWVRVRDLGRFFDPKIARGLLESLAAAQSPEQRQQIIAGTFANRGSIGTEYGDGFYVLAWNTPERSITQRPEQEGWGVADVGRSVDDNFFPAVSMRMNSVGAKFMSQITGPSVGRQMGMILDGRLISAPNINSRLAGSILISGGQGGFSQSEQDYLVRTLKAGSLKAQLSPEPIAERTMSPTLGRDNLAKGLEAAKDALIIVAIFMMLYYFFSGGVAAAALIANVIIILGVMAMYKASFTLPGIAGIVLTIGMCVDANVLIFERIREELKRGVDTDAALRLGYQRAFSSIIDANITNLIVCVILYQTATVEVRGFAVTLGVGICATLFTSLFMTRVIFDLWRKSFGHKAIRGQLPMQLPFVESLLTPSVRWISKKPLFFTLSAVAVIGAVSLSAGQGRDLLDIEFRAGTEVAFEIGEGKSLTLEQARERRELIAKMYNDDASLTPAQKEQGQRLRELVEQRRETLATQLIDEAKKDAEQAVAGTDTPPAPVDEQAIRDRVQKITDLSAIGSATVVGIGELAGENTYTQYSLVTVIEDEPTVSDAVVEGYGNVLDVKRSLAFDRSEARRFTDGAPVYPLPMDVAQPALSSAIADSLDEYRGGAVVYVTNIEPSVSVTAMNERLGRMRYQPDFEALAGRDRLVIGVTPVPGQADQFKAIAVLIKDEAINYETGATGPARAQWETMADEEWRLVRTALLSESSLSKVSNFSPSVAQTLRDQAIVAVVLSLMAIVAYIWFRFGSLRYGLAAIVALVHDVTISLGCVAATHYLFDSSIGEALQLGEFKLNLALIAALLTIIGYSLNDTIVLFDRIRENRGKLERATHDIINLSINQTISRTLLTSVTTLLAVLMLYWFGGEGIRPFAFTLIIGVLVGTYSSIAIAAPLVSLGGELPSEPTPDDQAAGSDSEPGA
jgi:SecD/SecF fusion protein